MLKVRCYRVLSQGDWEYARNSALCCSEEQHNILLMKLESHTSRETPKTLITPERHQGNAVLTFYFWPWVQRIIFFCFNIWLSTTLPAGEKKKTGFHSCKYCVWFKSWEKETSNEADSYNDVFYKLFLADSLQYVILYVPWEIYEHTSLLRVGKSLNNWPVLHLMSRRRGSSHRLLLPNPPDLRSAVNSNKSQHYKTHVLKLISKEVSHFIATRIRDSKVIFTLVYIS